MFQCIGQKRVQRNKDSRPERVRCENTSDTPTREDKPQWGWLCPTCSAGTTKKPTLEEAFDAGAMQTDPEEYRDQIASGFAAGARRSYEGNEDGQEE